MKIEKLKKVMGRVKDPRRTDRGHILHKLVDILVIGLCTILCNGNDFEDMEVFGKERETWFRGFLTLPNGIPDSDTFRRIFERINPAELAEALYDWLCEMRPEGSVVAIDGKTIRGSKSDEHKAYHIVSAFVAENQITLGEVTVEEKSNEIKAVPELLKLLDISGSTVTADAMSCQKDIVNIIVEKGAGYAIALKRNQPGLYKSAKELFGRLRGRTLKTVTFEVRSGKEIERRYELITDLSALAGREKWCGVEAAGRVTATVRKGTKVSVETRYYITTLTDVERFAYVVRKHWSIENQLHWCLDVIFHEDVSRAKKDNSPRNL
jgi:predicted transposase YbfD/YdcC